jgi:hypothetical protein
MEESFSARQVRHAISIESISLMQSGDTASSTCRALESPLSEVGQEHGLSDWKLQPIDRIGL